MRELSDILLNPHSSDREREKARQALERLSDGAALARLAQVALLSESPQGVRLVLDLLETKRGLTDVEPLLVGFLYDSSAEVRQKAIQVLASRGTPRMIYYLDEIIKGSLKDDSIFGPDDATAASQARQRVLERA